MRTWAGRLRTLMVVALLAALFLPLVLATELYLLISPALCLLAALFYWLSTWAERRALRKQEMLGRFDWPG